MTNDELFEIMFSKMKIEIDHKGFEFWTDHTRQLLLQLMFGDIKEFGPLDLLTLYMNMMVESGGIDRLDRCAHCGGTIPVVFEKIRTSTGFVYGFGTYKDKCPKCHEQYYFDHNRLPWEQLIIGGAA
jgi:recombinational DNA repair protein (RecF pathway)